MIRPEPKKDQQADTHTSHTPEPQTAASQSQDQQPAPLITDYASL